jgi:hypothetical protein
MSLSLKKALVILSMFMTVRSVAQTPQYIACTGEYQMYLIDLINSRSGSGNAGGATGASSGANPGLLTVGTLTGGGALPTIATGSTCLHGQSIISIAGNMYVTGINDNHSFGLGPSAGNQSNWTLVSQDNFGHPFTNIAGCFASANTYGSFVLAWKNGAQGDSLWMSGLLEGGIRGDGTNPTADSGYFVALTGFDAGDTIIDAKGDAILMVLTKNGTGVRKIYTSGNSSSFTGNGTSDLKLHKLTGLAATPKEVDLGVYWFGYLGTDGNLYAWGYNYLNWAGTLGTAPTTPTNVMTNIGMPSGSISSFGFGDICTYAINNSGQFYGWGEDICGGLGIKPKIHWNTYVGGNPLYGAGTITEWAWNQSQLITTFQNGVSQATLLDSCNTYLVVYAGHTYGCYTIAEDSKHVLHASGRNKGGVQASGVYDQQWINGNPEGTYPNSYDSASRDHEGWYMIFPWGDAGGVARHVPYCDTVPTATWCSLYTTESESPPTITGWSNQTISGTSTSFSPTITGQSGHSVNNIRVTERTTSGCPTSTIAQPYSATTTISGLTTGTHTIQIVATDDQYKQTTATAIITVGCSNCIPIPAAGKINWVINYEYEKEFSSPSPADRFSRIEPKSMPPNLLQGVEYAGR